MDHERHYLLSTLCLALALVAGPIGPPARAEVTGPPRVIDGDTLAVQGTVVRLYGIDAPEPGQACRMRARPYACGRIASTTPRARTPDLMELTHLPSDRPKDLARGRSDPSRYRSCLSRISKGRINVLSARAAAC